MRTDFAPPGGILDVSPQVGLLKTGKAHLPETAPQTGPVESSKAFRNSFGLNEISLGLSFLVRNQIPNRGP